MKKDTTLLLMFTLLLGTVACNKMMPSSPDDSEFLSGPVEGLSSTELKQHLSGNEAFRKIFTAETGLGPAFIANQCASCHAGDGKGAPFVELVRFGQSDTTGNQFLDFGAPQLQSRALPGHSPEVIPAGASQTTLIAPAVTGLGFLDAVEDAFLLALSDPNDADGDGISGRPHYNDIPSYVTLRPNSIESNGKYICRFGKKGTAYDLLQQSSGAFNQDMGITNVFFPEDPYSGMEVDPEVSTQTVHDVVFFLKTSRAPIQRNQEDPDVIAGRAIFEAIDCAKCHVPDMQTGYSPIEALSYKEFHPFTDLLLHDMGAGLNDNYTEGKALTSEWKTPALWGLGLSQSAQGGLYFLMHDGRAHSINEAIQMHGGEASISRDQYSQLSETEKAQLIKFLESL